MKLVAVIFAGFMTLISALAGTTGNVRVEVLVVRVPQDTGLRLRERLCDRQTVERAVAELKNNVAHGDAELIGAPVLWSTNGNRVVSNTTQELRYSTELDPVSPPQNMGIPTWNPPTDAIRTNWLKNLLQQFIAVPLAYETQNVGLSIELEAMPDAESQNISITMTATSSSLTGYRKILTVSDRRSGNTFSQPQIHFHQSTSVLEAPPGMWRLAGVSVIPGKIPLMEFTALRASIIP